MRVNRPDVTRGITVEEDFRRIDALPRPVREVYWRAPINIACMTPQEARQMGVAKARAEAIVSCAGRGVKEALAAYGPDHPCVTRLTRAMAIGVQMGSAGPAQAARSGPSGPQGRLPAAPGGAYRRAGGAPQ
jgi:hypothetical protein